MKEKPPTQIKISPSTEVDKINFPEKLQEGYV